METNKHNATGNNSSAAMQALPMKLSKDYYAALKNDLIISRQRTTSIWATRLLNFMVMQLVSDTKDFQTYSVKITELAKFVGIKNSGDMYSDIKEACREALGKVTQIGSGKPGEPWKMLSWLSKAEYDGKGTLYLSLSEDLKPYLLDLKESGFFTQYQIKEILPMNSSYAVRLYQLLTMENNKHRGGLDFVEKTVGELREYFGCENKFTQISQFKAGVIQTAVNQINKNKDSALRVEVEYIKPGKVVEAIRFHLYNGPLSLKCQDESDPAKMVS